MVNSIMLQSLKNRVLCSRPFLALHILCGKPVMYRMVVAGPVFYDNRNRGARIVGNTVVPVSR